MGARVWSWIYPGQAGAVARWPLVVGRWARAVCHVSCPAMPTPPAMARLACGLALTLTLWLALAPSLGRLCASDRFRHLGAWPHSSPGRGPGVARCDATRRVACNRPGGDVPVWLARVESIVGSRVDVSGSLGIGCGTHACKFLLYATHTAVWTNPPVYRRGAAAAFGVDEMELRCVVDSVTCGWGVRRRVEHTRAAIDVNDRTGVHHGVASGSMGICTRGAIHGV